MIGITRQWIGIPAAPFAYRGSIGPCPIPPDLAERLRALGDRLVDAFGLVGWFGVDFVLRGGIPWPVEINPRYTASLEIHELASGRSLLAEHRWRCEGNLNHLARSWEGEPPGEPRRNPARTEPRPPGITQGHLGPNPDSEALELACSRAIAKCVIYAPRRLVMPEGIHLDGAGDLFAVPSIADVPSAGTIVEPGEPIMTVFASGEDLANCQSQLIQHERYWSERLGLDRVLK